MTNLEIADLLRKISAAYLILGENRFRIIAYDRAADSIEHLTGEVKEYWEAGKLDEIPGVGGGIASNLDELFQTGKSKHWEFVLAKVPEAVFPLLLIPGIGPKKAYTLVNELKLTSAKTVVADLEKAAKAGKIETMEGFGQKSQSVILESIEIFKSGAIKENRMPLPYADQIAQEVIAHLKKGGSVEDAQVLGSLRRQVSTIGDVDIAVSTHHKEKVLETFLTYPHQRIVDHGTSGATILLHSGRQVDLRVIHPRAFGAMLQYFTGSKNHNIMLRSMALEQGLSLSEHGIKAIRPSAKLKSLSSGFNDEKKLYEIETEKDFYGVLGLSYIPPELREDKGEISAAKSGQLPKLVELSDIKGDLHTHSNYDLSSSHDVGKDSIAALLSKADMLGYEYMGFSDHNPRQNQSKEEIVDIMKRRREAYDKQYDAWRAKTRKKIGMFLLCEVDILPDGSLALPEKAFDHVDGVIVSIHSAFTQEKDKITERIIRALTFHPKVRIYGHPTGRLLGSRQGVDASWPAIFDVAKDNNVALEIDAYPERLDLPDSLVYDAKKLGISFTIDSDAHEATHMDLMKYGVSVARRGWVTKHDVLNTLGYNEFKNWLLRKGGKI